MRANERETEREVAANNNNNLKRPQIAQQKTPREPLRSPQGRRASRANDEGSVVARYISIESLYSARAYPSSIRFSTSRYTLIDVINARCQSKTADVP